MERDSYCCWNSWISTIQYLETQLSWHKIVSFSIICSEMFSTMHMFWCYMQRLQSSIVRHQHKGVFPPVHWAHDVLVFGFKHLLCVGHFWHAEIAAIHVFCFSEQIKFDQHNLLPSLTQRNAGLCAGTITFSTHWTTPCRMRPYEWLFGENYSILKMSCVPSFLKIQVHLLPSERIYDITPEVITQKHWTFRIMLERHW